MANEEDLVSQVIVTGAEESAKKLDDYATKGAAAFDKLDKAAKKAAGDIKKSTDQIDQAGQQVSTSFASLAKAQIGKSIVPDLGAIEQGTRRLVASVRAGIPAIASFVTRLTAAGAGAAAAGVGILKLAANVTKATQAQEDGLDKQTKAQIEANNSQLAGTVAAINLESQQRQLFKSFQKGEITFTEYSQRLRQLNDDYNEQQRVARQVEAAQESVRLENERLTKQAADTAAFKAQADIFGGPLLSSLLQLGNAAGALFRGFRDTFGPAVSAGIDLITKSLSDNGSAISTFFSDASRKIADFISKNGPAISQAFETIGNAIKAVFDGIISALPGLLDFFNNNLVPAIKGLGAVLDGIASTINTIFGTKLTGGAVAFLIIVGQMTGAFVALINVLRIFAAAATVIFGLPFGGIFLVLIATIATLLIVFPQLRQVAVDVFNSILQAITGMVNGAVAAGQGIIAAFQAVVAWFAAFPGNLQTVFNAVWEFLKAGWQASVDFFKALWNGIVDFISGIIDSVKSAFNSLWEGIKSAGQSAIDAVKGFFASLYQSALQYIQPILDMLNAVSQAVSGSAFSGGGQIGAGSFAGGGRINGPGSGTSDSVPLWGSNGEWMIKARSVAKYGNAFMSAINNGTFDLGRHMRGYAEGGLITMNERPSIANSFKDSGGPGEAGRSMTPVSLTLFGETFAGLMAPEEVAGRLTRFAVQRNTRAAGRKPGWVGGGR